MQIALRSAALLSSVWMAVALAGSGCGADQAGAGTRAVDGNESNPELAPAEDEETGPLDPIGDDGDSLDDRGAGDATGDAGTKKRPPSPPDASALDASAPDATTPPATSPFTVVRARQTGSTLTWTTIWGSSANNVYFGGTGGAVARWNGTVMTPIPSFTSAEVDHISGGAANHVWVDVGGQGFQFDGTTWKMHRYTTSFALDASSSMGLFAFQNGSRYYSNTHRSEIIDRNGTPKGAYTPMAMFSVHHPAGAFVASPNDVWVPSRNQNADASTGDDLEHWNGTTWSVFKAPLGSTPGASSFRVRALSGTSSTDVWLAGTGHPAGCPVRHWDGLAWSASCPGLPAAAHKGLLGVYAATPTTVWAVGYEGIFFYDGASWSAVVAPPGVAGVALSAAWGTGPSDVWVAGTDGVILHKP